MQFQAMTPEDLVDHIYEAAVVPELWPAALDGLSALSGSVGGGLLALDKSGAPWRLTASAALDGAVEAFLNAGLGIHSLRFERGVAARHPGFRREIDFMSPDEIEADPLRQVLRSAGLGWQCASANPIPGGTTVLFTLERRDEDGPHTRAAVKALDRMRPHLMRSALLAVRLGLERSRTAVATLQVLDLPAAVLTGDGRVLASNDLLDVQTALLSPAAHGRISLVHPSANALYLAALERVRARRGASVWSIPVPADSGHPAAIIHVLPLSGASMDVFSGAQALLVVAAVNSPQSPDETVLNGLFDLTPAEARLARALTEGHTIPELAGALDVSAATLRTQLAAIFGKTGTRRQGDLLALLSGIRTVSAP